MITSSGSNDHFTFAIASLSGEKDEDRFFASLSHIAEGIPSMTSFGVFDGHGKVFLSNMCLCVFFLLSEFHIYNILKGRGC